MSYKLEVNFPEFDKDTLFDIGGVAVKNGGSVTLSADDEARICAFHGADSVKDALGKSEFVKISGTKEGGDS